MSPNNMRQGNNDNNNIDNENEDSSDRVPEPTCVFGVCSCQPGWAFHADSRKCIEAPQPEGKTISKLYKQFDWDLIIIKKIREEDGNKGTL